MHSYEVRSEDIRGNIKDDVARISFYDILQNITLICLYAAMTKIKRWWYAALPIRLILQQASKMLVTNQRAENNLNLITLPKETVTQTNGSIKRNLSKSRAGCGQELTLQADIKLVQLQINFRYYYINREGNF